MSKKITFEIPTSWKEFRQMLKERSDKRYKHNRQVLNEYTVGIIELCTKNGYWDKYISESMKQRAFRLNSQTDTNALGYYYHKAMDALQ